ncbi:MAG: hypothetical protein EBT13_16950, partial [Rhodobacteraceae bacterium]|nr:hypothetical protein [Paracoccaceae bacterium]
GNRTILQLTLKDRDFKGWITRVWQSEDLENWTLLGPLTWSDDPRAYDGGGMIITATTRTAELTGQTENPFLAYDNLAALSTTVLGGTAVLTDGAAANAVTGTTYDYWLPNVTGTVANFEVKFPAARTVGFVGIAAHNLGTLGATVAIQSSTDGGATWPGAGGGTHSPTDDRPIGYRLVSTGADAADWRIRVTGLTAGAPLYIGVAFFGAELVFPRRFYKDFAPVLAPTEVQLQSNVSVGGQLLGNSIIAQGSTLNAQFRNLDASWVRASLLPFIPHFNKGKGFFFGWRPATYPQDIHYCWREGATLRPVNAGPKAFMSAEMQMRAHEP